jgi:hypothetical protein
MENRQQQILSEIKEMMTSIRMQLEQLDAKMAELQYEVDPQPFMSEPIDLTLDDFSIDMPSEEPVIEAFVEAVEDVVEEVVEESVDEVVEEDDDLPFFDEPEDLPSAEPEPQPEPVAAPVIVNDAVQVSNQKTVVLDAMTAKQTWRTDMPGAPVRDIRSAISLNDRVLFINRLFDEDPVKFQETLSALNQIGSLDEAVAYLVDSFPSWNLESELVYRFMMALRRKLN